MKPLFLLDCDVHPLEAIQAKEGTHYDYDPVTQTSKWYENAPTMSTTQTFSGGLSDDTMADSE